MVFDTAQLGSTQNQALWAKQGLGDLGWGETHHPAGFKITTLSWLILDDLGTWNKSFRNCLLSRGQYLDPAEIQARCWMLWVEPVESTAGRILKLQAPTHVSAEMLLKHLLFRYEGYEAGLAPSMECFVQRVLAAHLFDQLEKEPESFLFHRIRRER